MFERRWWKPKLCSASKSRGSSPNQAGVKASAVKEVFCDDVYALEKSRLQMVGLSQQPTPRASTESIVAPIAVLEPQPGLQSPRSLSPKESVRAQQLSLLDVRAVKKFFPTDYMNRRDDLAGWRWFLTAVRQCRVPSRMKAKEWHIVAQIEEYQVPNLGCARQLLQQSDYEGLVDLCTLGARQNVNLVKLHVKDCNLVGLSLYYPNTSCVLAAAPECSGASAGFSSRSIAISISTSSAYGQAADEKVDPFLNSLDCPLEELVFKNVRTGCNGCCCEFARSPNLRRLEVTQSLADQPVGENVVLQTFIDFEKNEKRTIVHPSPNMDHRVCEKETPLCLERSAPQMVKAA